MNTYEPVHELVAAQAAARPDQTAIVHGATRITYGELDARADRMARELVRRGVRPDTPVGVFLDRSPEFVLAILAILKAGGGYVPLDPVYPPARLSLMLAATGAPLVITSRELTDRLDAGPAATVSVEELDRSGPPVPLPGVLADSLAYVMFTSGSTGTPKGVMVRHAGITRLVRDPSYVRLGPGERVLHISSTSFDAATFEIWGALAAGATLVVGPAGRLGAVEVGELLREHGVTTAFFTTGLFHLLVDECLAELGGLRQVLTGGDVLSPGRAHRLREAHPDCVLINAYGPTEMTTFTTSHVVPAGVAEDAPVPIGLPIDDTWVRVLDDDLRPVPEGGTGTLYAGGGGLARGYLGDPALTAERFVPDPEGDGERLYATGDLVRVGPGGALDFLGRADQQIKRRGFRVEPAEIEEALLGDPEVAGAAVVAAGSEADDKILVAFLVPVAGGSLSGVPDRLRLRLPGYLIPDRWQTVDELPLNANGKVDRPALRALAEATPADTVTGDAGPRGPLEAAVAEVWRELFAVDRVGRHDDFFALGGHSLLAGRMTVRLAAAVGVRLPVGVVFDHPTVAGLAAVIEPLTP